MAGDLPPQLQRDGGKVDGGIGHHGLAGLWRAGKKQMVERQLRKQRAQRLPWPGIVIGKKAQLVRREILRADALQQPRQMARVF